MEDLNKKIDPMDSKQEADIGLIIEFMNAISNLNDRDKMIKKSLEFFNILFTAEKILFYDTAKSGETIAHIYENYQYSGSPSNLPALLPLLHQRYIWSESALELLLPIQFNQKILGYLEFTHFSRPEFRNRYLLLLLLLSKYWGPIFNNIELNERIKQQQERFQIVADYSHGWEVWFNSSGFLEYNSPSCKKISGYAAENVSNFFDLMLRIVHPHDLPNWKTYLVQLNSELPIELRIKHPSGTTRWVQVICVKIITKSGNFIGYRGSIQDITKRKEAEENVSILQGMLPICSFCKKIRSDQGYWNQIEDYLRDHSELEFSHSVCPECAKREYGIE